MQPPPAAPFPPPAAPLPVACEPGDLLSSTRASPGEQGEDANGQEQQQQQQQPQASQQGGSAGDTPSSDDCGGSCDCSHVQSDKCARSKAQGQASLLPILDRRRSHHQSWVQVSRLHRRGDIMRT
eukprot:381087-Pelagomonas_calceolata.AAC.6